MGVRTGHWGGSGVGRSHVCTSHPLARRSRTRCLFLGVTQHSCPRGSRRDHRPDPRPGWGYTELDSCSRCVRAVKVVFEWVLDGWERS